MHLHVPVLLSGGCKRSAINLGARRWSLDAKGQLMI